LQNVQEENKNFRIPGLISDGMVLQRNAPVKIWGWARENEKITIEFIGKVYNTITKADGRWSILLNELKPGGPYSMNLKGSQCITLKNILIGDVWVCSGQSNMQLKVDRVKDIYKDEISNCYNTEIRQFVVPEIYDFNVLRQDVESSYWELTNPQSVLNFTATGYFFAKALYEKYHVPIGLINTGIGGTPAEAWLSEDALKAFPNHLETAMKFKNNEYIEMIKREDETASNAWYSNLDHKDKGLKKGKLQWYDMNHNDSKWLTLNLPGNFKEYGFEHLCGVVWVRKEIEIPAAMIGEPASIWLGTIVDSDTVYINGTFVGATAYRYPPRKYDIPENLLKEGKNIIAIRVISNVGEGGFVKDKPYQIKTKEQIIELKGKWKYKIGVTSNQSPEMTFIQYKPLGLFNGMISPILNYAIKGVIWYQGESNTSMPKEYYKLFSTLIRNWRQKWNQGDFPFLYVQLANYMEASEQPSQSNWAELREAQLKALVHPNTGMVVTTDIGEWNDLHPLNKKDVGYRLALTAQKIAYGESEVVCSGPIYQSMIIEDNKVILTFTNAQGGLAIKNSNELRHFAIAGDDKKFIWAKATIKNDKVVVWCEQVAHPVYVRYAWADNPEGANLYNKEGLPASAFRTDK